MANRLPDEAFYVTYADGVADIDLSRLRSHHDAHGALATVTVVRPGLPLGSQTSTATIAYPAFRRSRALTIGSTAAFSASNPRCSTTSTITASWSDDHLSGSPPTVSCARSATRAFGPAWTRTRRVLQTTSGPQGALPGTFGSASRGEARCITRSLPRFLGDGINVSGRTCQDGTDAAEMTEASSTNHPDSRALARIDKHFWRDRRVLVTGHTGFKGGWLALWLQSMGSSVSGLSLGIPSAPSLYELARVGSGMAGEIAADVRDFAAMKEAIDKVAPEILIHMAAQPIVRRSFVDPRETFETNVMGTVNLL